MVVLVVGLLVVGTCLLGFCVRKEWHAKHAATHARVGRAEAAAEAHGTTVARHAKEIVELRAQIARLAAAAPP